MKSAHWFERLEPRRLIVAVEAQCSGYQRRGSLWCVAPQFRYLYFSTHELLVSQFTLLASTKKGTKPDFQGALGGEQAKELYQHFFSKVQQGYKAESVKDGVFQAMMVCYVRPVSLFLLTSWRKLHW